MSEAGSSVQVDPATGITIDLSRETSVSGADLERELTEAQLDPSGRRIVSRLEISDARIHGHLVIENALIGSMDFLRTTIETDVTLRNVILHEARFHTATLDSWLLLDRCGAMRLEFTQVVIRGLTQSPGLAASRLDFQDCIFESPVRLSVTGDTMTAIRCDFRAGLDLSVKGAQIAFDESRWGAPSVVAFLEQPGAEAATISVGNPERPERPQIVSLRRANVDGLLLSGVGLRMCRFVKAHNLDRLRLENDVTFARAGFRGATPRRVISEEAHWRTTRRGEPWTSFYDDACEPPDWLLEKDSALHTPFDASLVASIYRSLRKGREDAKDEPGAADFYYGEMEMRRLDDKTPSAERAILWLYWLVSGYGLRAFRAFVALLAAVFVSAALLDAWGFDPDRGAGRSLLVSVQSTTSLLRGIDQPFTPTGELVVTTMRLLGPLLLGLMILSLRGRVKR
jgi:uncharacterized protein YjbI with pentapeptide repeats